MSAWPAADLRRIGQADAAGTYRMAAFLGTLYEGLPARLDRPGGAWLVAMGPGHLVNKVSGLGLAGPVDRATLERIERLFAQAGVDAGIEAWPGADPGLQVILEGRGWKPRMTFRVLAARIGAGAGLRRAPADTPGIEIERVVAATADAYEEAVSLGFMDLDAGDPAIPQRVFARGAARSPNVAAWLARIGGEPAGGGAMSVVDGIAGLFGASTRPRFRCRGVQHALLERRLWAAQEAGGDVAFIKAMPGSGSERNALRAGFEPIGVSTLWGRERDA